MLKLKDVCYSQVNATHSQEILRGVSIQIEEAQFVAISGKSGAGKTTLLQLMSGLLQATHGVVILGDKNLSELSADARAALRLRHIGFVHQSFRLLPQLSLWQNACLPCQCLGQSTYKERVRDLFSRLGISHLTERKPQEVSGGELQRAAIARALASQPSIILADEPTGNLDEDTALQTVSLLMDVVHDYGVPLVLVTHDIDLCKHADRHYVLERGALECLRS